MGSNTSLSGTLRLIEAAATTPFETFWEQIDDLLDLDGSLDEEEFIEAFLTGAAVSVDVERELEAPRHFTYKGCEDIEYVGTGVFEIVEIRGTVVGLSEPDYRGRRDVLIEPAWKGGERRIDSEHIYDMLVGYLPKE